MTAATNLSLRQLRAFAAVAEAGSFTEAAQQLHLTQSALSVLVREMERELGVQLFDRTTRRVQLCEAGRDLYPQVQRLLNDLASAVASVTNLRDNKKGVPRLAAPQLMACTLMPRVIAAWSARHPGVEVQLADTLPEHLLAGVLAGEIELAVGPETGDVEAASAARAAMAAAGAAAVPAASAASARNSVSDPASPQAAVVRRPLFRDRHWLVCPPGHPLAQRGRVRWSQLRGHPFIAPTRDFLRRIGPQLDPAGRSALNGAREVSYITTALGLVAAGLGVTACPTYATPLITAYGLVRLRVEAPVFYREVCVYSAAGRSLSPAAASFAEFLAAYVAEHPVDG